VVHVKESVSYTFDGDYIYVYRMINTSAGESIRNIEGYCSNNSCKFRVETTPEGYKLMGELPEPTPKNLTFLFPTTIMVQSKFTIIYPNFSSNGVKNGRDLLAV